MSPWGYVNEREHEKDEWAVGCPQEAIHRNATVVLRYVRNANSSP